MITIDSLSKKYGAHTVVDDISFVARQGRVTGFLGPNGAGKSTSMRMMVGLTSPTSGSATISGRRFADLPNPGREVGVMLDASAQHAGRTGREILTIAQRMMGLPARRVAEMLELVSLTETEANRRVGNYSLGMRQRLGIATALIGEPVGAHPRRAGQRARPGRHPLDAGPAPRLRGPRRDRPAVLAPAARDRGHRRRHRDDRQRPDRLPGLQDRAPAGRGHRRPRARHVRPPAGPRRVRGRHDRDRRRSPAHRRRPRPRRACSRWKQASPSPSCAPPKAASRTCSSSSPPTPNEKGKRHDRHHHRHPSASTRTDVQQVPLSRVIRVELRKMFDTRSGFWLMASIVIAALLATVATIAFAPDADLTYYTFAKAIGFPMTVVLPMIAILSITGEWSQRSGLTTFTLVPHRSRVILAKVISSVAVAVASMLFAFAIGAVGNVVGTAIAGTDLVWDVSVGRGREHRAGQPAVPADRHHAGHADPQLGGGAGGVLRLRAPAAHRLRVPGRQPGLVPGPAAVGGPQLRPGRPLQRHPDRRAVGERRGHRRRSGSCSRRSSASGWS